MNEMQRKLLPVMLVCVAINVFMVLIRLDWWSIPSAACGTWIFCDWKWNT